MYSAGYICKYIQICINIYYIFTMNYFLYGLRNNPNPPYLPYFEFEAGMLTGYVSYISLHTQTHTYRHGYTL